MSQYLRVWRSSKDRFGWLRTNTNRPHLSPNFSIMKLDSLRDSGVILYIYPIYRLRIDGLELSQAENTGSIPACRSNLFSNSNSSTKFKRHS
jgi:hypothetical protein